MKNRWEGIKRNYTQEDVKMLRGSVCIEHTLAKLGSEKLWKLIHDDNAVRSLGALTGNQAVQQVRAGLKAIYVSGWQCAADANLAGQMYPDQSLYPANSVPMLVKRINQALLRADQVESVENNVTTDWLVPVIADAEAGFGGNLNSFELMKGMIEAGAAGVHFEDQLASEKKCGHLGGKVLVPTAQFIKTLTAARLAADVCNTPTVLIARTDADSAKLLTSDVDPYDDRFIDRSAGRTPEGYFRLSGTGMERCVARGLAYAPYADMIWMETSTPDLEQAKTFAESIKKQFPDKLLAYNCSPSFNWKQKLDDATIRKFQSELNAMGYKFQFITLAGFHSLNYSMYTLAKDYSTEHMSAYSRLQQKEFESADVGYTAVRHQREVGTGYFDKVSQVISGGTSSTLALEDSTEKHQF